MIPAISRLRQESSYVLQTSDHLLWLNRKVHTDLSYEVYDNICANL